MIHGVYDTVFGLLYRKRYSSENCQSSKLNFGYFVNKFIMPRIMSNRSFCFENWHAPFEMKVFLVELDFCNQIKKHCRKTSIS